LGILAAPISYWIGTGFAIAITIFLLVMLSIAGNEPSKKPKPREIPDVEPFDTRPAYDSQGGEWRRTVPDLPGWKKES
jgi:hypothetical protein